MRWACCWARRKSSSLWIDKVVCPPFEEHKAYLFLLESVTDVFSVGITDVFLFRVIDGEWWGMRVPSTGPPDSNFS